MQQTKSQLKKYLPYLLPILSFVGLTVLLNRTNPLDVGPAGILLVFGLVYVFISSSLYLLLTLVMMLLAYFVTIQPTSRRKMYYLASIIAFAPVFLLALNSIGQLELKDFVLVFCLVGLACFYVVKRR
ncbi:MAG TPA: hypothetical protein VJM46_00030 [Candidatus Saccharimonadales bacterium]|nr:hypothetical protein [Candidatus Saccharimonadales bacterium]